jgi:hypothetical protein
MLIMKSFFLNDLERFQMEEIVLRTKKGLTEGEILKLDDCELMELVNSCQE